jgi:hypothetical protein
MMTRHPFLEGITIGLAILLAVELGRYFREPVAPDEKHLTAPTRTGFELGRAPQRMVEECRAEGKQLAASSTDGQGWIFECVIMNLSSEKANRK